MQNIQDPPKKKTSAPTQPHTEPNNSAPWIQQSWLPPSSTQQTQWMMGQAAPWLMGQPGPWMMGHQFPSPFVYPQQLPASQPSQG